MASGNRPGPRGSSDRPRAAVHPRPVTGTTGHPRPPLGWGPALRAVLQHFLVAGPVFGVLSALYSFHLAQVSPATPNLAMHEVIREAQTWHGHFLRAYYISAWENALGWALALPAMLWLVGLVGALVALGIRTHYSKRSQRRMPPWL